MMVIQMHSSFFIVYSNDNTVVVQYYCILYESLHSYYGSELICNASALEVTQNKKCFVCWYSLRANIMILGSTFQFFAKGCHNTIKRLTIVGRVEVV